MVSAGGSYTHPRAYTAAPYTAVAQKGSHRHAKSLLSAWIHSLRTTLSMGSSQTRLTPETACRAPGEPGVFYKYPVNAALWEASWALWNTPHLILPYVCLSSCAPPSSFMLRLIISH